MARMERYSDEEVAKLEKLVQDNAGKATPLTVAELAVFAEGKLTGRTADALKQRIFKMQREHTKASRPAKKVAGKIPKPKPEAARAAPKKRNARFLKDPVRKPAPRNGILRAAPIPTPVGEDLVLTLPSGARVAGRPSQIAELVRSL